MSDMVGPPKPTKQTKQQKGAKMCEVDAAKLGGFVIPYKKLRLSSELRVQTRRLKPTRGFSDISTI
jgi:hypothetical protein